MFSPVPAPSSTTRPRALASSALRWRRTPASSPSQRKGSYSRAKTRSHTPDLGRVSRSVPMISVMRQRYERPHRAGIAQNGHLVKMAPSGHVAGHLQEAEPRGLGYGSAARGAAQL